MRVRPRLQLGGRPRQRWRGAVQARLLGAAVVLAVALLPTPAWAHVGGAQVGVSLQVLSILVSAALLVWAGLLTRWSSALRLRRFARRGLVLSLPRAARAMAWPLRLLALGVGIGVWVVALIGPGSSASNLAPHAVFLLWAGGIVLAAVLGDFWAATSPFETVARLIEGARSRRRVSPAGSREPSPTARPVDPLPRLGVWPAAAALLVGAWLQLVLPSHGAPLTLGLLIWLYVVFLAAGASIWGRAWLDSAEVFDVLFRTLARGAILQRDHNGLRLRPPLAGLAEPSRVPGTAAVLVVALAALTFDGVTHTIQWQQYAVGVRSGWATVPLGTLGLLATLGIVAGLAVWTGRLLTWRRPRRRPGWGATDALVPLVAAYALARHLPDFIFEGQLLASLASDPLQRGLNLLGTARWSIHPGLSLRTLGLVQIAVIVAGHGAALLIGFDRALLDHPERSDLQSRLLTAIVASAIVALSVLL